jgi:phosphatidate phosphatase
MLSVEVCIEILHYHIDPFKRGFFCDDESLMHPFSESTIGSSLIYVGFGLPLVTIALTEITRWKLSLEDKSGLKLFGREIPRCVKNVYKYGGIFLFGNFVTVLLTDAGKHVVGRFRPHFLNVCQPLMPDGSTCADEKNFHRYIVDFTCGNAASSAERLKEMRLSFPSGHSSIAMYTMLFTAIYIHFRMNWKGSKLLKHFLQFIVMSMAWLTALSRISDYKHHCKDNLKLI